MLQHLKKLTQREFWPRYIIYTPVYFYWFWLGIKSKSLMFPYIANPGMPPVDILQFSKWQILKQLAPKFVPKTHIITAQTEIHTLKEAMVDVGTPCIIKPDVGERARGVKQISSFDQLINYIDTASESVYLLQSFIDWPLEFGVMWYRYPSEENGTISGLVAKIPLSVTGDGEHTLGELIMNDERTAHYEEIFKELHAEQWDDIPPAEEEIQLTVIGNHARGSKFIDRSELICDEMVATFDALADQVEGFHYGRFDVKVASEDDLITGEQLKVIEINGIQSEPAHIYDPDYKLIDGYKELFHHWKTLYKIAKQVNEKEHGNYEMFGSAFQHLFGRSKTNVTPPTASPTAPLGGVDEQKALVQSTAELVQDYLQATSDQTQPTSSFLPPDELIKQLDLSLDSAGTDNEQILAICKDVLKQSVATQNKYFFNQLYAGADIYGIIGDRLTTVCNTNMHIYEIAPVFNLMEQHLIDEMSVLLGWQKEQHDGLLLPGGSTANMYALHCARFAAHPEVNSLGMYNQQQYVVFTSDQAHYSITKSAMLLGIGKDNVVEIPTNNAGQMIPSELEDAINTAKEQGNYPLLVNATAGTTVLGAFDPFAEIAQIAKKHKLRFHIDGALGAAAAFSDEYKGLLAGVEQADSITFNPHKMLGVPLQCSVFLTQDPDILDSCNSCQADYLFPTEKGYDTSYDTGDKYLQCGRRVDAFKFWLMRKARGSDRFAQRVGHAHDLASYTWEQLQQDPCFLVYQSEPERNNTCFWYIPTELQGKINGLDDLHTYREQIAATTRDLKQRLLEDGKMMINSQPIKSYPPGFRWTFIRPELTKGDIDGLIRHLSVLGKQVEQAE